MKNFSRLLKTKLLCLASGLLVIASITACSNSTANNSNGASPTVTPTAVTIDNAGVIPVFGNSSTSTVVYVHNNTNKSISGISYGLTTNVAHTSLTSKSTSLFKRAQNLASIDASQCSTVAANQACPIAIVTPMLNGLNTQGSIQIKASYNLDNHPQSFTQLISYAQVQNNTATAGAKFQSGASISGYGNPTGYATIYLYGSGQNQVYDVSSITINKPAITIVNGNISGQQIQSNFVQAVEISSPIANSSISAAITVDSNIASKLKNNSAKNVAKALNDTAQFSNSVDVAVEPAASGAILTTGLIPLINTATTTSGSVLVRNAGNQTAELGSVTAGSGISNLSGCSNSSLAPSGTCTISFNVTESGGNANITIPYTGGSASNVVANVTWYNGVGAALVSMSSSADPLSFLATVGGSTTITVTNIGGYSLNNISIPAPIVAGGNATTTLGANNCATIDSLAIGSSCEYTVNANDNQVDLGGQINVGFNASYAGTGGTKSYSRVLPITYNSTSYSAIITITPATPSLTISGNNFESTTLALTISNSGNLPANITNILGNNPSYLIESATTCGATLNAESSCTSTLKFGPTYSAVESSGTSDYTVSYTANGQTPTGSVASSISWNVQGYAQSISIESYTVINGSAYSGNGTEQNPYIFSGNSNNASMSIGITYKNTGNSDLKLMGIQDNNSPYAWQLDMDVISDCYIGSTLTVGRSCTLYYLNKLSTNILAIGSVGAVYTENLTVPTLIYQDATNSNIQFNAQANLPSGGTVIYAQSNQATLANTITVNEVGTANESVTISHLLANAAGYNDVFISTTMENYLISGAYSPTCSSSSMNEILTQTCTLSENQLSGSGTYMVNQTLLNPDTNLTLTALFDTNLPGQGLVLSVNPIYATANLGLAPFPNYVFVVDSGVTSGITQCIADPNTGEISNCNLALSSGFANPRQITLHNNFAYVTNTTGSVSKCPLTYNGIDTCTNAGSGLSNVNGIVFNDNYVYITSLTDTANTIQKCLVSNSDGSLSNCSTVQTYTTLDELSGMTINNSYLYITSKINDRYGIQICTIGSPNGELSNCSQYSPKDENDYNLFNNPTSIAINNSFAYVTNSSRGGDDYPSYVIQCSVNPNGSLSDCAGLNTEEGFYVPSGISITNNIAYITNSITNFISSCPITPVTGTLTSCLNGGDNLNAPFGITTSFP